MAPLTVAEIGARRSPLYALDPPADLRSTQVVSYRVAAAVVGAAVGAVMLWITVMVALIAAAPPVAVPPTAMAVPPVAAPLLAVAAPPVAVKVIETLFPSAKAAGVANMSAINVSAAATSARSRRRVGRLYVIVVAPFPKSGIGGCSNIGGGLRPHSYTPRGSPRQGAAMVPIARIIDSELSFSGAAGARLS